MNAIFVFGSNLQGRHGKGAALHAKINHGAKNGVGVGMTGNSYALPTKITPYQSLSFDEVKKHIADFLNYAEKNNNKIFHLTKVGCGLAGFKEKDISELFKNASDNIFLINEKEEILFPASVWNNQFKTVLKI